MNVIVCLDKNNGMMFNERRQSQDRIVLERILEITKDSNLFMNSYSYELFKEMKDTNIFVCDNFLEQAAKMDYCFVENESLIKYKDKIKKIIVFRWNRVYPADVYFDLNLDKILEICDFQGSSHDITLETYEEN
ncbi:MAG: hypothetical protein ACOX1S_03035 [Anaerostipes sp.]